MARRPNPRVQGRKPGQSARERQKDLASVNPGNTLEQAWGTGAEGEEHVGRLLNRLDTDDWLVMHDIRVSRSGKNVDHLVIGPPGVFVVETKNVSGEVSVNGPNIAVGGYSKDYVEKLEEQAILVRDELIASVEWDSLWVQGLLVFVAPNLTVSRQPDNVVVLTDKVLLSALTGWVQRLSPRQVRALARATRTIWE